MILRYLMSPMPFADKIMYIVFGAAAVLFVLSAHEWAHGMVAYWMGDRTAKNMGRLTLNPLKHLDPMGAVCMLLFGFGWAKPVPIRARNFKKVRLGIILTSAAGPLMNFIIGFIAIFFYYLIVLLWGSTMGNVGENLTLLLSIVASVSIGLGVFNLIPLPPLDGSKIVGELLPMKWRFKYYSIERYSTFIFIGLILALEYFNFISPIIMWLFSLFSGGALSIIFYLFM